MSITRKLIILIITCGLCGAMLAYAQDDSAAQVFELTDISVIAPTGALERASIEVTNRSTTRANGVIWYYLAPVGSTEPWLAARYTSTEQSIELGAGETTTLTFDAPGLGLIGTYDLSFWAHYVDPVTGARNHSDGQGYAMPIVIEPPGAFVLTPLRDIDTDHAITRGDARTFESQRLKMTDVHIMQIEGRIASVQVDVLNVTDMPVDGFVWYILAPPDSEQPWTQIQYIAPEQRIVQLAPNERTTYTFIGGDMMPAGRYALWVYTSAILDAATGERGEGDGVAETIVFGQALQTAITAAEVVTNDDGTAAMRVRARVDNFSGDSLIVGMFYTIAPPNMPSPWRSAVFNAPIRYVQVGAGESVDVAWDDALDLPAGTHAVTLWMFQVDDGALILRDRAETMITR